MEKGRPAATVDEYISQFPEDVQHILVKVRAVIRESAPEAVERMSYRMPGYFLKGALVWFAAYKHHIGLYPKRSGIDAFEAELSAYKKAKGSVQLPLNEPMPCELISRIVRFRVAENLKSSP